MHSFKNKFLLPFFEDILASLRTGIAKPIFDPPGFFKWPLEAF
jgi:hypothetical protein